MPNVSGATWLIEAYYELSTARMYHLGGAGPIPIEAIWSWSDRYDAPPWFVDALISIDAKFLEGN